MIRYIVLLLTILLLSLNLSALICFPVTYPALFGNTTTNSTELKDIRFNFSPIQKTMLFGSTFAGFIIAVIPFCALMQKYKCHRVLTVTSSMSAIILFLTPISISSYFPSYIFLRVLQSAIASKLFIVTGFVVNEWAPKNERGFFVAVLSSIEISALFSMTFSGIISENFGWPSNFYFHGFCVGIVTLLWSIVYRDNVLNHPFLSAREKYMISEGKDMQSSNCEKSPIPYKSIIKTPSVLAIWISALGNFAINHFNFSYSTIYVKNAMNVPLSEAGRIVLIPMTALIIVRFITGKLSDSVKYISELNKIRFFNSLGFFGTAVFLLIIYIFPHGNPDNKFIDIVIFTLACCFCGFASGGTYKSTVLVAGQYSSFVFAVFQMIGGMFIGLPGAVVIPRLAPEDTPKQWSNIFLIYAIILAGSNAIFLLFARASPEDWSIPMNNTKEMKEKTNDL
ncbi:unnamed protein product [Caenorhabditis angaria]|uniref:Major facilitator superfamily (MFS) profile domain-containing protein n=1 Tax=Caenorhabditis angaria TaxID=860376 RepID=A0A9P1ICI9_9PELO|nr:unnamed protein product [Caenorhabditis angaria]